MNIFLFRSVPRLVLFGIGVLLALYVGVTVVYAATLASNTGQTDGGNQILNSTTGLGQVFTTGTAPSTLTSVTFEVVLAASQSDTAHLEVSVQGLNSSGDPDGEDLASVDFFGATGHDPIESTGTVTATFGNALSLRPSTSYAIVFDYTSTMQIRGTAATGEDSSSNGWTIGNVIHSHDRSSGWSSGTAGALELEFVGDIVTTAVYLDSSSDTETVTTANIASASTVDNHTSDYTPELQLVGFTSGATVTVTATSGSQTDRVVTRSGDGAVTLPPLVPGTWAISATDGTNTAATLTIKIESLAPLRLARSGSAQSNRIHDGTYNGVSQPFTTGSDSYLLTGLSYTVGILSPSSNSSATFSVAIQGDDGEGNPDGIPLTYVAVDHGDIESIGDKNVTFPDGGVRLAPSTQYHVVFRYSSNTADLRLAFRQILSQPPTSSAGWSFSGQSIGYRVSDSSWVDHLNWSGHYLQLGFFGFDTDDSRAIILESASDTGSSNSDGITSDTTPSVTVSGFGDDERVTVLFANADTTTSPISLVANLGDGDILGTRSFAEGVWKVYARTTVGGAIISTPATRIEIDRTAPALSGAVAIGVTGDTTPDFTFTSSEAGTIVVGGSCVSTDTALQEGENTITFTTALTAGTTYSDCTITPTDVAGNQGTALTVPSFTVLSQLVSNEGESSSDGNIIGGNSEYVMANRITVSNTVTASYTLEQLFFNVSTAAPTATTGDFTVSVQQEHSSEQRPSGTDLATVTIPSSNHAYLESTGVKSVTFSSPAILQPGVDYWVVFSYSNTSSASTFGLARTTSANQAGLTGWGIGDVCRQTSSTDSTWTDCAGSSVLVVGLYGREIAQSVALKTSSDTGESTSDNITNDATPTIVIDGFDSTPAITVTADHASAADVTVSRDGDGDVTLGTLADGTWTITASAGGNTSPALTIYVDTADPSVSALTTAAFFTGHLGSSDTYINKADSDASAQALFTAPTGSDTHGSYRFFYAVVSSSTDCSTQSITATAIPETDDVTTDGTYKACVTVEDVAGNTQTLTSPTFTRDTVVPVLSQPLSIGSVSNPTPAFTFTSSEVGAVTVGGSCSAGAATATASATTITLSTLSPGTYGNCTVTVTDVAGNASAALSIPSFTIIAASITISMSSDPAKLRVAIATVTGDSPSDLLWALYDPNATPTPTCAGSTSNVVWDANQSYTSGAEVFVGTVEADNGKKVCFRATVNGAVIYQSSDAIVGIDRTPPVAPTQTPDLVAAGDTGSSDTDNITNQTTGLSFTIGGLAAENGGVVTFWSGSTSLEIARINNGTATVTGVILAEGVHEITARAIDVAANTGPASPALTVTVDTTAPAAPGIALSSDTGSSSSDKKTNDATLAISSIEAGATWEYKLDTNGDSDTDNDGNPATNDDLDGISFSSGTGTTIPKTAFSGATDGIQRVLVRQTDVAGNNSASSAVFDFTLDTTNPTIANPAYATVLTSSTGYLNLAGFTGTPQDLVLAAVATDAGGSVTVTYAVGAGSTPDCSANTLTYASAIPQTDDVTGADGDYSVCVKGVDVAGNIHYAKTSFIKDTTPPAQITALDLVTAEDTYADVNGDGAYNSSVDFGSNTDNITSDDDVTFTMSGKQGSGSLVITADPATAGSIDKQKRITLSSSNSANSVAHAFDFGGDDDTYSITAVQIDRAGNPSTPSAALSVTIDTTAPNLTPTIDLKASSDTGVSNTDNYTNAEQMEFTIGSLTEANLRAILKAGSTVLSSQTGGFADYATATTTDLTWDNRTVKSEADTTMGVVLYDQAGNKQDFTSSLTVYPDYTVSVPFFSRHSSSDSGASNSDGITNNQQLAFTLAAVEVKTTNRGNGAQVTVYDDSSTTSDPSAGSAVALASEVGHSNADVTNSSHLLTTSKSDYANGKHTFYACQEDDAGNSACSLAAPWVVDITVPDAPGGTRFTPR